MNTQQNKENRAVYMKKYHKDNPDKNNAAKKRWRHKKGINKKYNTGVSYTKEYQAAQRKAYKHQRKCGGRLALATVQSVYEDNIKKFGTLTCYLCLEFIPFGKDHLEHKVPISRGGTNEYSNLGVACQHCNCKKGKKTDEEFKKCL